MTNADDAKKEADKVQQWEKERCDDDYYYGDHGKKISR